MLPDTATILNRFFRTLTPTSRPLLLLDYDGTLAPFNADRFQSVPWPGVRDVLNCIQARKKTRIAIITGRPASEIAPLLALNEPVEVWGLHGFERLHSDGRRELEPIPPAARQRLDGLRAALGRDVLGGLVEHKLNGVAIHWRGVPAREAARIEQRARGLFEPIAQTGGFRLLVFEAGIELRFGRDKGGAVAAILAKCGPRDPVAYLGDDLTDEAAFRALKGRGLSVLVRTDWRETAADVWLKPPEELLEFVEAWLGTQASALGR